MSEEIIQAFLASEGEALRKSVSQKERYEKAGATPGVMTFINLCGGAKLGTKCERFARYRFPILQKRKSGKGQSGHDHLAVLSDGTQKLGEQKSGGLYPDGNFMWDHIEPKHPWDFLLLCGVEYHNIKFWAVSKPDVLKMMEDGKITKHGNKAEDSYEGWWCWYSKIKDNLTEITSNEDLVRFLELK
jgi:hypothetical protein